MSRVKPYGAAAMMQVSSQMSASDITCIAVGHKGDMPGPGALYDDHTERPEEVTNKSELTELS